MGRVIVVGSINVDLVVRVATLPGRGQTVVGSTDVATHHGGKGGNQAVAAARTGAQVFMVGTVGSDAAGDTAKEALRKDGVDVSHVTHSARATGAALIVVDDAGDNQIAVAAGANAALSAEMVREAMAGLEVGPEDVVLVSCEIPAAAVAAVLEEARDVGALSVLNPAPAKAVSDDVARLAAVLTPNETELRDEWLTRPTGTVVVTRGEAGASLHERGGADVRIRAPAVTAVDATGAGDTFNGVLCAFLAEGVVVREAVERAVAAASLSTTRPGAREGMPTAAELAAFIGGTTT